MPLIAAERISLSEGEDTLIDKTTDPNFVGAVGLAAAAFGTVNNITLASGIEREEVMTLEEHDNPVFPKPRIVSTRET